MEHSLDARRQVEREDRAHVVSTPAGGGSEKHAAGVQKTASRRDTVIFPLKSIYYFFCAGDRVHSENRAASEKAIWRDAAVLGWPIQRAIDVEQTAAGTVTVRAAAERIDLLLRAGCGIDREDRPERLVRSSTSARAEQDSSEPPG